MCPEPTQDAVSRLKLELWALGQLPSREARALESRSHDDAELKSRMEAVKHDIEAASIDLPPLQLPAFEAEPAAPWWRSWLPVGFAGALVAAAAMFVLVPPPIDHSVTWRGDFDLAVHRVRLGEASEQGVLIHARPGDRLQYEVTANQTGWLSVYNLQDDGDLQTYLEPRQITPMSPVRGAFLLDDYGGTERVYFVVSDEPVLSEDVTDAVERVSLRPLAELDRLPALHGSQKSIHILKENDG